MARLALVLALLLAAAGCGGSDESAPPTQATQPATTATPTEPETEPGTEPAETETATETEPAEEEQAEALPGLPDELAGYDSWTRLNAEPIPPRSPDPHEGTKNVYASVGADAGRYPDGAIVVKEAVRPGADFIGLIAMMRKERGAQPDHNDWVWVEWVRDGPEAEFSELASGSVCYSCDVQARATDYVFTR